MPGGRVFGDGAATSANVLLVTGMQERSDTLHGALAVPLAEALQVLADVYTHVSPRPLAPLPGVSPCYIRSIAFARLLRRGCVAGAH